MELNFIYKGETKTCFRFERGNKENNSLETLYLKKETLKDLELKPENGISLELSRANNE